jgi:hypothetical protein
MVDVWSPWMRCMSATVAVPTIWESSWSISSAR